MNNIVSISASRISNQSVQARLISQLDAGQTSLYQLETQISTGHQYQLPSESPDAALQVMGIQSLLQREDQLKANITTNKNFLSQTDSTLSSASSLLTSIQSAALGAVGSTASPTQRQAVIQQIQQTLQQLVTLGNQQFNGRQLFGGTDTSTPPFSINGVGNVVYSGTTNSPQTYVGLDQLFSTSITGDQAFGAMSPPIEGAVLSANKQLGLTAALTASTPLADLYGGRGVAAGSIAISDGHNTTIVDLRGAQSLGDVATMIHQQMFNQSPQTARIVDVDVTSQGLTLTLEPGTYSSDKLTVQEVGGNTTAHDLGIFDSRGVGNGPLVGQPLQAGITPTTSLDDLFGTTAQANIHFGVPNSDIVLKADTPGSSLNGVTVQFVNDLNSAGQEWASYSAGALTVHMSTSATSASRADQIIAAINAAGSPFTASLDPADQNGGGQPPLQTLPIPEPPETTVGKATTSGGSGTTFDSAGLQITSEGKTYIVNLSGAKTFQDLINRINNSGAGLDAEINAAKNGIYVRSRISGNDFTIGENGGTTATQLGLRTLNTKTPLSQLNHGAGVGVNSATPGGTDFTITVTPSNTPGTTLDVPVSIAGDSTIGDVINSINSAAQSAGVTVQARLTANGNGIELVNNGPTDRAITINVGQQSTAAVDLGLVPKSQTTATLTPASTAVGALNSGLSSGLFFQAVSPGAAGNVQVSFQLANPPIAEGNETAQYDSAANTLTFQISSQTNANDVIAALTNDPIAGAAFTASLDTASDPTNDGSGVIQPPQQFTMYGGADVFTGSDTNPRQTTSIFTALLNLSTALKNNDAVAVQLAMGLLSNGMQNLNSARGELGSREQALSTISTQIDNTELNLKSAMSTAYDTDMTAAASNYAAAQVAYQATLQTTANLLKITLLNYL
jgi:flagellar hook-associated protein 3